MPRKEKSSVNGEYKESWSGIEIEGKLSKRRWGWRLAWLAKKEASHLLRVKKRYQCSDQIAT